MPNNFASKKFAFVMTCLAICLALGLADKMQGIEVASVMTGIGMVYLGGQSYIDGKTK